MAKQRIKTTVKRRVRKTGGKTGYKPCGVCHGTGRVKAR